MVNVKIKTSGMHCPSCEMLIKDSLEELDGVDKAEASYKSGIVSVDFDSKRVTKEDIVEIINNEGYEVE
jgi:copper chaperone CopZ